LSEPAAFYRRGDWDMAVVGFLRVRGTSPTFRRRPRDVVEAVDRTLRAKRRLARLADALRYDGDRRRHIKQMGCARKVRIR
jgi:hypothetical protein